MAVKASTSEKEARNAPTTDSVGRARSPEPGAEAEWILAELPGSLGTATPSPPRAKERMVPDRGPAGRPRTFLQPEFRPTFEDPTQAQGEPLPVPDTSSHPWRMICLLDIQGRNGERLLGTGWFAGPRTLITAGHCVFDPARLGGRAEQITVYPGRWRSRAPFGSSTSTDLVPTSEWESDLDPEFDYAAIQLDPSTTIAQRTGWFSTVVLSDAGLLHRRVHVSGYLEDRGSGALQRSEQWFHSRQIVEIAPRRLLYDAVTREGQSGSPVWIDTDAGPRVIAIHAYGKEHSPPGLSANSGPRITKEVWDRIRAWVQSASS